MDTIDPLKLCPVCEDRLRLTTTVTDAQVAGEPGQVIHTVGSTLEPARPPKTRQDILTTCPRCGRPMPEE